MGNTDDVGGLLVTLSAPFAILLVVVFVVYLAGFHSSLFNPKAWLSGFAAAALATLFSLGLYGASVRTNDTHAQQIPIFERLSSPEAYPGDYYADTAAEFPSYAARFLATRLGSGGGSERQWLALHAVGLMLIHLAFFVLAYALFESLSGASLSLAMFTLFNPLHIASPLSLDVMVRDHFDLTMAAWPFLILALAFWCINQAAIASLLAGLVCYVNPMLGAQGLALMTAASVTESALDWRKSVIMMGGAAVIPGLLVSLPVWKRVWLTGTESAGGDLARLLHLWYPAHYFASSWTLSHWVYAVSVLLFCAWIVWKARTYEEYRTHFPAFLLGATVVWLGAFILSDLFPFRPAIIGQFFRSDSLLLVLALAVAGQVVLERWKSTASSWGAGALILLALAGPVKPLYLLFVAVYWVLEEWAHMREFESYGPWLRRIFFGFHGVFFLVSLLSLWSARGWTFGTDRSLGTLLVLSLVAVWLLRPALLGIWTKRVGAAAVLFLVFFPAIRVIGVRHADNAFQVETAKDLEIRELAQWAQEASSPENRFLVPPNERFRMILQRPVVFEWVDGAAMHWAPGFEGLWEQRVRSFRIDEASMAGFWAEMDRMAVTGTASGGVSPIEAAYRSLSEDDLASIASKYQAAILVTYADQAVFKKYFQEVKTGKLFRAYQYLYNYP